MLSKPVCAAKAYHTLALSESAASATVSVGPFISFRAHRFLDLFVFNFDESDNIRKKKKKKNTKEKTTSLWPGTVSFVPVNLNHHLNDEFEWHHT